MGRGFEWRSRQAKDFQERHGTNVKTNDSGCKAGLRKARVGGGVVGRRGTVTRVVATTRTMTISFYFPCRLVSLARSAPPFDFYFFPWSRLRVPVCPVSSSALSLLLPFLVFVLSPRTHTYTRNSAAPRFLRTRLCCRPRVAYSTAIPVSL